MAATAGPEPPGREGACGPPSDTITSREPGAGSREPGAGSREPGAGSREPGAGSREPGAVGHRSGKPPRAGGRAQPDRAGPAR
ncbi:hypothetical protein CDG81_03390 [Actinopolyspora erythraea]|uniref:Uncharacterized protein n=1 Tax=Actinopolyspora erythraea TaxID=414996 RepID=A0A223RNP1_9ACTN|nr:hypothetical protein CDG81_03390 [Actinopolyspora erythraea]